MLTIKNDLLVVTEGFVEVVRILKGIKAVEGENCHTGPIIAMLPLETAQLTEEKIKSQAKVISISLDNSMRIWDPIDLSPLEVLVNQEKEEMSCIFYLVRANIFVTGHEDGVMRLWNIDLQTSITLSQESSPYAHKNNVCAFAEYIHARDHDDVTEYLFSAGYEGKVNVWEIFLKKSNVNSRLMSSTICPQLKFSFTPDDLQQHSDQIGS